MVPVVAVATAGGSSGVWFGLAFLKFILLWNLTTQVGDRVKEYLLLVKIILRKLFPGEPSPAL